VRVTSGVKLPIEPAQFRIQSGHQFHYSPFLGIASRTGPNASIGSITYNACGRPQSSTSPYGAQTTYTYTYNPTTQKATTSLLWMLINHFKFLSWRVFKSPRGA
jgi:hypothetical protein